VTISGSVEVCVDAGSITLTANVIYGIGPFDYLWSTGATTPSISENPAIGMSYYSVTVTDHGKSETVTDAFEVNGKASPANDFTPLVVNATVTISYDTADVSNFFIDYGDSSGFISSLTHTYVDNGNYTIHLYASNICGPAIVSKDVTISGIGVFVAEGNSLEFDVYPNPGNGAFTLSSAGITEPLSLMLFDLNGKMVYENRLGRAGAASSAQLNFTAMPKGVYSLQLLSGERSGFRKLAIY